MDYDQIYALVLTGFIAPLLTYAVAKLFSYLDEKMKTVKGERLQKTLKEARLEMETSVRKAIIQVNETYVNALKADGEFCEEDARLALIKSVEITKNIMSEAALNILVNASIAIDEAIKTEIEVQLPLVKPTELPAPSGAPRSVEIIEDDELILVEETDG